MTGNALNAKRINTDIGIVVAVPIASASANAIAIAIASVWLAKYGQLCGVLPCMRLQIMSACTHAASNPLASHSLVAIDIAIAIAA